MGKLLSEEGMFMFTVLLTIVMTGVNAPGVVSDSTDYASAYQSAQEKNQPLVVVVGAEWCPACVNLKQTTIASMEASGELQEVSLAVVDQDAQPDLARQIKQGEMIPQIVVFHKTQNGWRRSQLTGFQSAGPIRSLIRKTAAKIGRS